MRVEGTSFAVRFALVLRAFSRCASNSAISVNAVSCSINRFEPSRRNYFLGKLFYPRLVHKVKRVDFGQGEMGGVERAVGGGGSGSGLGQERRVGWAQPLCLLQSVVRAVRLGLVCGVTVGVCVVAT